MAITLLKVLEYAIRLTEASIALGLPKDMARELSCYTTYSSICMLGVPEEFKREMAKLLKITWSS